MTVNNQNCDIRPMSPEEWRKQANVSYFERFNLKGNVYWELYEHQKFNNNEEIKGFLDNIFRIGENSDQQNSLTKHNIYCQEHCGTNGFAMAFQEAFDSEKYFEKVERNVVPNNDPNFYQDLEYNVFDDIHVKDEEENDVTNLITFKDVLQIANAIVDNFYGHDYASSSKLDNCILHVLTIDDGQITFYSLKLID